MSLLRSPEGFSDEDLRIFRLLKIVMCEGHKALLLVYRWGYLEKHHDKPLIEYLKDNGMSKKDMKRIFDKTMHDTMKNDPTGNKYDVSLLYVCIMYGCECLSNNSSLYWREVRDDKVESLCTFIKNFRNELTHGKEVKDDIVLNHDSSKLEEKLEILIRVAGSDEYYKRSKEEIEKEVAEMKTNINNIMTTPMKNMECIECKTVLEKLRDDQKNIVVKVSNMNLPHQYKAMSRVDPASFITGEERLEVSKIFTQLEVVHEKKVATEPVEEKIDYRNLFELKTDDGREPTLVVVEGDAGAGKTTLSKLLLNDWADWKISEYKNPVQFHSLNNYELILFAEGRNRRISNFANLLKTLMPQADLKLTEEDLVRAVSRMKTLLILDGLDELSKASKNLIIDIVDKYLLSRLGKLHLLITTRPHTLSELPSIIHGHPVIYTRLKGISPDKYEEFVEKLHQTMISKGLSSQSTDDLIDYVRQSREQMGEHYRLPLNLTLLTYLWAADPGRVNSVTTVTELYVALLELIQSRLVERLHEQTSLCKEKLHILCQRFLRRLYSACLQTLIHHDVQLSKDSLDELRKSCDNLGLKFEEMTAPFLSVEKDWSAKGYTFELFVPHKSIMEFYAAHTFLYPLLDPSKDEGPIENIIREIEVLRGNNLDASERENMLAMLKKKPQSLPNLVQTLLKKDPNTDDLSPFQNVFIHLGGLLAHQENLSVLEKCGEELINIFKNAKVPDSKLLEFLTECKCNKIIARLIAQEEIISVSIVGLHAHIQSLFYFLYSAIMILLSIIMYALFLHFTFLPSCSALNCKIFIIQLFTETESEGWPHRSSPGSLAIP